MPKPRVEIDLAAATSLAAQMLAWKSGGVFAPGVALEAFCECDVALSGYGKILVLPGRVIMVTSVGVGIEFVDFDGATNNALQTFGQALQAAAAAATTAAAVADTATNDSAADDSADVDSAADDGANVDSAADDSAAGPKPAHERLRNLAMAEQVKFALKGDLAERILLERIYGKTVWEPLLRNPRVTPPEVARISRMGTLPRPLLETICLSLYKPMPRFFPLVVLFLVNRFLMV